jgi:hypothetical protein
LATSACEVAPLSGVWHGARRELAR